MDNYLTKLSKIEILLTNIGHGQNFDKHWTETGQNLDICQKIVQILSNPPFYRSTHFSSLGRATSGCVESESTETPESRVEQGSRLSGSPVKCIGASGRRAAERDEMVDRTSSLFWRFRDGT